MGCMSSGAGRYGLERKGHKGTPEPMGAPHYSMRSTSPRTFFGLQRTRASHEPSQVTDMSSEFRIKNGGVGKYFKTPKMRTCVRNAVSLLSPHHGTYKMSV